MSISFTVAAGGYEIPYAVSRYFKHTVDTSCETFNALCWTARAGSAWRKLPTNLLLESVGVSANATLAECELFQSERQ